MKTNVAKRLLDPPARPERFGKESPAAALWIPFPRTITVARPGRAPVATISLPDPSGEAAIESDDHDEHDDDDVKGDGWGTGGFQDPRRLALMTRSTPVPFANELRMR
ncbi:GRB2-associated and regulator of MAPK protein [Anopheles sinensis]|uniref:GRB2-associated and regulator of MAPK protein n=1 Tax=Anopheles sinensis TaxID=74873 RepID=A0A084VG68_ANOSI|nr:GRB2-associated and regulator of MAPK protein [Anopheles sinensis]